MLGSNIWWSAMGWKVACGVLFTILLIWNTWENLEIIPLKINQEYEYIIVGTGVGGATVASGINSEDVLVLEAGNEVFSLMNIPVLGPMLQDSPYEWNFYTEPQENAAKALKKRQVHWTLGKIFGGSHMLNNQIYIRGHPDDYREFAGEEYDFQRDIERHFEQFESDMKPQELKFRTRLADAFIKAGQESQNVNFTLPQVTQKRGMRYTVANFYQNLRRNGHRVVLGAFVTKVTFEDDQKTADGVKFIKSGKKYSVRARKGVILSAGAVGSPKILLQSGIGPKDHLADVGIHLRVDLPVGENLMDHVTTGYNLLLLNESLHLNLQGILSPTSIFSMFFNGEGPMSMPGCESLAILPLNPDLSKLQFMVMPVGITQDFGIHLRKITNINDKVWKNYFEKMLELHSATILPIVLHPKSRGVVRLRNADPQSSPIIDPRYFSHAEDKELLVKGIQFLEKLFETEALQKIGAEINPLLLPGCESHPWSSREYWTCYVEHLTLTTFHPAGTCSIGKVVEKDFRVMQTRKLFVVDASVMPNLPTGNPMGSVGMLANRFLTLHGISRHFGH
ncbi:glucose dehydrogenase [FAD, quinone]-like [Phlebotomus argentipes]|uniref:glucose dehydrogenase [FAD, quinone]-like n=1 Tax=Phlebotomus argentipes TaxID=94469 RepID=UPI00289300AF|nr:glucose dehydrogenase [FAD, quinone]-like [Phlebotomus argentipes]